MAKQTPNFGLTLFPQSDTTTSVREFRTTLAGDSASSNMMLIDQALKDIQDGQVALPSNLVIWDDGQLTDTLPIPTLSPEIPIVADIAARDALDAMTGMLVYVEDASADPVIESGGACYIYNAPSWLMIAPGSISSGGSGGSGGGSIVSQPDEPDDPNAMIWIDTDDQQVGVDLSTKADLVGGKVPAGQLPAGVAPIVTTKGDGAAYTASVPGITQLALGMLLIVIPHTTSTTKAVTLNVNDMGPVAISRRTSAGTSAGSNGLVNVWLSEGLPLLLMYDGTYWIAIGLARPSATDLTSVVPVSKGGTGKNTLVGTDYTASRVREISAGTTDLAAGTSDLESGTIYLVYE